MPLPVFPRVIPYVDLIKADQLNILYEEVEAIAGATPLAQYANTETISATKTLADSDALIQRLTASGADRNVNLPAAAPGNHPFFISNPAGSTYNLVVKGGPFVEHVRGGESLLVISTGTEWTRAHNYAPDYIRGLKITRASDSSLTVGTGEAMVNGSLLRVTSPITYSSITWISGLYYLYLYSSASVVSIFLSTTAPAASPYYGMARTMNGDVTKRYLGAWLSISATGLVRQLHNPATGLMSYTNTAAPRRILTNGGNNVKTSISTAAVVPAHATHAEIICTNTNTSYSMFIVDDDDAVLLTIPANGGRNAYPASLSSGNLYYRTGGTSGSFVDVGGYWDER